MDTSNYNYCPFYCEENIWHLCQDPQIRDSSNIVLFISNDAQSCAISNQKTGQDGLVIWDYHVVLYSRRMIWDLDSMLLLPCPAVEYLNKSFDPGLDDHYQPSFKLVNAEKYIGEFASDRRHMINQEGKFIQPPPNWPAIRPEKGSNIFQMIDMRHPLMGEVCSLMELINALDC